MQVSTIALAAALALAGPQPEFSIEDPGIVNDCLVTLIKEAEVPALEAGQLVEFTVREGQEVKQGDLLAQIDDRQARKLQEIAKYKLDVAEHEANNMVSVEYAQATQKVAQAEYEQAMATNRRQPNTIPQIEVRRYALKVEEATLQIQQAKHDLKTAEMSVGVRQGELDAAELDVEHRRISAPFDGMVEKRSVQEGEWVRPGDPVLRLIRMDRLRVEAFLDGSQISAGEVDNKPVTVEVALAHGRREQFPGKIVYVSPVVEAGSRFLVWAEVINRKENGQWLLRPGQDVRTAIHWRQPSTTLGRAN